MASAPRVIHPTKRPPAEHARFPLVAWRSRRKGRAMMGPGHRETARGAPDSKLDSRGLTDAQYLARLGYKQELRRALGLFSSFGVQFSSIATISALFTTLVVGLAFFGPASFWSWIIGGSLQVFAVGIAVAELVSAYPLAGGVYQINSRI